jgi:type IV fimbrial biogenesis protein FimT
MTFHRYISRFQAVLPNNTVMSKSHGFTLVELMVVIAIAAVLASLAAPSFSRLIESTSLSSDVNTFLADTRFARNEAVKRGTLIVMCKSANPEVANPDCAAGDNWKSGWIIFEDRDNSGTHTATEPLLRQQGPLTSSGGIIDAGGTNLLNYVSTGRLRSSDDATQFTFGSKTAFDSNTNDLKRVVCIPVSGRARIAGNGGVSCASGS